MTNIHIKSIFKLQTIKNGFCLYIYKEDLEAVLLSHKKILKKSFLRQYFNLSVKSEI